MVQRSGERLRVLGDIHQTDLQRRRQRGPADTDQEREHQGGPRVVGEQREQDEYHRDRHQPDEDGPDHTAIGKCTAGDVAGDHAEAEQHQCDGDERFGHSGNAGQRGADVGVEREHPAESDDPDEQREPHLRPGEGAQFGDGVGDLHAGQRRQEHRQGTDGQQPDHYDHDKCGAPSQGAAEPGGGRDADHVGDAEAQHHLPHRLGPCVRAGEVCGDQSRDPEVGAVGKACDKAGHHEHAVTLGEHGGGVADGEGHHQGDQECAPGHPGGQRSDQRCTHHDTESVGRDDVSGGGFGGPEGVRDRREQSHRHELGGADPESAQGKSQDCVATTSPPSPPSLRVRSGNRGTDGRHGSSSRGCLGVRRRRCRATKISTAWPPR